MAGIRFEHVRKRYANGFVALHDLNLEIKDREFVVLLGPSGCGKSTTLNMIAGLEEVTEGRLWFDGDLVNDVPPNKRDVAMVFQSYALYPHKSVAENIAFGLRMRNHPKADIEKRVRETAAKLDISHLLSRMPGQLSGGQRQRVALGRAMVRQPAVFLMDEPLSNLDAALRITMRAEIKQLHHSMETTFVYVTHDQAEALTLADRIVVMKDGVIQQIGTPDDIYERPANLFVASFLGSPPINFLDGRIENAANGLRFRTDALTLDLPAALAARLRPDARNTDIVLGLRPEDVDERATTNTGATLTGPVTSVMPVGSDQYLGLAVGGRTLFFRVGKDMRHREGEVARLGIDLARLHLFDKASGATLLDATGS